VIVYLTETEVPDVFSLVHSRGGVNEMLVEVDFDTTVFDWPPHAATIVWVKLEACLVTVRVWDVPRVPLPTAKVDFLGMVSSVPVPDPDFVPI
jgi:hypothetical protein